MNRNHLALFFAVAEAGGITRGAEAAGVSQPAVSKQIAELERALGVRLLDRLPRGARLTEAGELLAGYARRIAAMEREAEEAIEQMRGLRRGRLAMGASTTIGAYLLPQVLGQFRRQHPQIQLRVEIANTRAIQALLADHALDIGLTEGLVESEELESQVFHQDELVPIAAPDHPLLRFKRVSAARLCREPFVMREQGSGTRAVVERALAQRGLCPQTIMALGSTEAIKRAVACGLGVGIVSRLTVSLELQTGRLALIEVPDLPIRRPLHLQRLRGKSDSPSTREFLSLLARHPGAEDHRPMPPTTTGRH